MFLPSVCVQGDCNEAINFYKEVLGAEVRKIMYASEAPPEEVEGLPPDYVTYSEILIYGTPIMMIGGAEEPIPSEHFWFTLALDSAKEATSIFNKLAESGEIIEPLAPQFWAALNGDVKDRFGITWNIGTKE